MSDVFFGQAQLTGADAPLVSLDDFTEWFGLTLTTAEEARARDAISIASRLVRDGRRIFTLITDDVVTIDGPGGCEVLLPKDRLPVVSVSSITNLGTWDTDPVTLAATDYDWSESGIIYLTRDATIGRWWTPRRRGIVVTYTHGYADLPRDVAGVVLDVAKRKYDNPTGSTVKSETIGDYSVSYDSSAGGLLPDEILALRNYEAPV